MAERNLDVLIVERTTRWLEDVVIGLNLCPFAAGVRAAARVAVVHAADLEVLLTSLALEAERLIDSKKVDLSTTLLVATGPLVEDFDEFLDALEIVNQLVCDAGWEGVIQVASFHPDYRFDGEPEGTRGNFTNRSPYPTFHLLRESDVTRAVDSDVDVAAIPAANIQRLEALTDADMKALFP